MIFKEKILPTIKFSLKLFFLMQISFWLFFLQNISQKNIKILIVKDDISSSRYQDIAKKYNISATAVCKFMKKFKVFGVARIFGKGKQHSTIDHDDQVIYCFLCANPIAIICMDHQGAVRLKWF